jgi:hypothetical protein
MAGLALIMIVPLAIWAAEPTPADPNQPAIPKESATPPPAVKKSPAVATNPPVAHFPEQVYTFQPVVEGSEVTHEFVILNKGLSELQIENVKTG